MTYTRESSSLNALQAAPNLALKAMPKTRAALTNLQQLAFMGRPSCNHSDFAVIFRQPNSLRHMLPSAPQAKGLIKGFGNHVSVVYSR